MEQNSGQSALSSPRAVPQNSVCDCGDAAQKNCTPSSPFCAGNCRVNYLVRAALMSGVMATREGMSMTVPSRSDPLLAHLT